MWAIKRARRKRVVEIEPDEIFADSSNIPEFDTDRLEGRVERPLARRALYLSGISLAALFLIYSGQAWNLQIRSGVAYAERAENNQLEHDIIFADRGIITDRIGRALASNVTFAAATSTDESAGSTPSTRVYALWRGISFAVGYAKSPKKDASGFYFQETSEGISGAEAAFNEALAGQNGRKLTETSATGKVVSESTLLPPQNGQPLQLSIDAAVSQELYDAIAGRAQQSRFSGGAGVVMDITTGEILALVSYPEYPLQTMADGVDASSVESLLSSAQLPFLDRAVDGLYAPGSIVKPFVAVGALTEGVISETTQILSTGSISIPNPYDPAHPSVFKDWRPQGFVDVRHAIAVSSDVFFYEVGGGYENQPGIGIGGIDKYLAMFGFGSATGLQGFTESAGSIPSPAWKAAMFPGDPWRIGDTYHTAIGQYGVTVTPLQAVRAAAAIANGGELLTPTLLSSSTPQGTKLPLSAEYLNVAREGMRLDVSDNDTAAAVNLPFVEVAAKTGTAQIGSANQYMNSWIIGFFPYQRPRYAFAIVLEKAPAGTLVGAPAAALDFLTWMNTNAPQYLQ